jgi:sedoheptulokinase
MTIAVLRGMAEELHQMYDLIREGTGITALRLIGSGNGLRLNPALQDVFRGTFQLPLSLSPFMEEAACGAAMCSCFRDIR